MRAEGSKRASQGRSRPFKFRTSCSQSCRGWSRLLKAFTSSLTRGQLRLLSFLPLTIRWTGEQAGGEFRWTATEARLGWRWFGRTFDRPAPAERLRREPWRCRPVGDDLLVFRRSGVGALVFKAVAC